MINKITKIFLLIAIFAIYTGCNSAIYEIVEVEEPIEEVKKEEIKEDVNPPVTDIKEDTKPTENKFSEKQVVSRNYVIQIGAFRDQNNADIFTYSAKRKMSGEDIVVKNIEGMYKIRLGNFNSKEEAINYLNKTKDAGFGDSFVVELTYIKQ
jgi:cell division protein FtsN